MMVSSAVARGGRLEAALTEHFRNHPNIGDIRGRGLLRGLELVADRTTKMPFDPERAVHFRIKRAAMDEGLLCYPMGGTVDGRHGDHVLLAPPFIISDPQIEDLVSKLDRALTRAIV